MVLFLQIQPTAEACSPCWRPSSVYPSLLSAGHYHCHLHSVPGLHADVICHLIMAGKEQLRLPRVLRDCLSHQMLSMGFVRLLVRRMYSKKHSVVWKLESSHSSGLRVSISCERSQRKGFEQRNPKTLLQLMVCGPLANIRVIPQCSTHLFKKEKSNHTQRRCGFGSTETH